MADLGNSKNTIEVLNRYGFKFQKKFGQNFLIDTHVLEKIVSSAEITKDDYVLEIGPGIGTLTQYLCEAAKHVLVVEIDKNLIPILENDTLKAYDNKTIINADFLELDLKFELEKIGAKKVKIVANLPYYITTPIIMGVLEGEKVVESLTVMVQKEVALRMQAGPGTKDYGALSLAVQYYSEPYYAANVPMNCFMPRPNVDSAVIRLKLHNSRPVECRDERFMFEVIKASFMQRRKTLLNGLRNNSSLGVSKEEAEKALTMMGLDLNVRGETLSLEEFAKLSDCLLEVKNG